jgi:Lon protease-like protein
MDELPVFPLHAVTFPGAPLTLRVFEPRYRRLVDDVLPDGLFVVVAIRRGAEVGGPAEPHAVGVTVGGSVAEPQADGTLRLDLVGRDRVALIEPVGEDPYPTWRVAPYPDEGGAGSDDLEEARRALVAYLRAVGVAAARPAVPSDPVAASYVLAAAAPGLPAVRQALLETPGAGERLAAVRDVFAREARLVRTLGSGAAALDLDVSPN